MSTADVWDLLSSLLRKGEKPIFVVKAASPAVGGNGSRAPDPAQGCVTEELLTF